MGDTARRHEWAAPGSGGSGWRIANHPSTITRGWYERIVAETPSPVQCVELALLVAMIVSVDSFAEMLELDVMEFRPDELDGEPQIGGIGSVSTHWVPTTSARGPNVMKSISMAGERDLAAFRELCGVQYVPVDRMLTEPTLGRRALNRQQIELVAARTSQHNKCFY